MILKFPLFHRRVFSVSFFLMIIPLILSGFTHIYNPVGFPYIHGDEGHYMRRAMHILAGGGPQEPDYYLYDHPSPGQVFVRYDHPYLGQLFLAGSLWLVGYPNSLHPSPDNMHSIEMLYLIPRILMGILAVGDTFLIYKIVERRYNRNVAFVASILFAVMPLSWLIRRILLESLQLPFLLSSILFAVYSYSLTSKKNSKELVGEEKKGEENGNSTNVNVQAQSNSNNNNEKKNIVMVLLSGIFLGLAIFTKIPAITMIPMVGFLVFTNNKRNWNTVVLWIIPVILIPLIWPAYAISVGEFHDWLSGILYQTGREGSGILSLNSIFRIDPVLVVLGMAGIVFTAIKRDFFPLLWIIPFFILLYLLGFNQHFHWVPILPIFCIATAVLIVDLAKYIIKNTKVQQIAVFTIACEIIIFGMVSTTMLLSTNLNLSYFEMYTFVVKRLSDYNGTENNNRVAIIGNPWIVSGFSWIPRYIFHINQDFILFKTFRNATISEKILLMVDKDLKDYISADKPNTKIKQLQKVYDDTKPIATFKDKAIKYNRDQYPYTSIRENRGIGRIDIRANY